MLEIELIIKVVSIGMINISTVQYILSVTPVSFKCSIKVCIIADLTIKYDIKENNIDPTINTRPNKSAIEYILINIINNITKKNRI